MSYQASNHLICLVMKNLNENNTRSLARYANGAARTTATLAAAKVNAAGAHVRGAKRST